MPLTREEARRLAQQHLDADPFPCAGYRWKLTEPILLENEWYFNYEFESVNDIAPGNIDVAGAPCFAISASGARTIGWAEYHQRGLSKLL